MAFSVSSSIVLGRNDEKTAIDAFMTPLLDFGLIADDIKSDIEAVDIERDIKTSSRLWNSHKVTVEEETNWHSDILRCKRSPRILFRQTIMMEALQRHSLDTAIFEWSCENAWLAGSSSASPGGVRVNLAAPKPDLEIGFNPDCLLATGALKKGEGNLESLMKNVFPGTEHYIGSAFPFFFMEFASARIGPALVKNDAVHALYNIWKVMNSTMIREKFFSLVRVFTITVTSQVIQIRMHRAELRDDKPMHGKSKREQDMCLWHRSTIIESIELNDQDHASKSTVLGLVEGILNYARFTLRPILAEGLQQIVNNAVDVETDYE